MNTKIYIVEDEPLIAETIKTVLTKDGYTVVGESDNVKEALFDIEHLQPDMVLLDINLEGELDGIFLAESIRKRTTVPFIFLTSLSDDETLEKVKQTNPAGYIIKPFNERTLKTSIELALHKIAQENQPLEIGSAIDSFFIKEKGELVKIDLNQILYFEAYDNYSFIHLPNQKKIINYTLKTVEEKLSASRFLRVHRSYIVNLDKITSLQEGYLFMNHLKIPVSQTYRNELMAKINLL